MIIAQQLIDASKDGGAAFIAFSIMVFLFAGSLFYMDRVRRRARRASRPASRRQRRRPPRRSWRRCRRRCAPGSGRASRSRSARSTRPGRAARGTPARSGRGRLARGAVVVGHGRVGEEDPEQREGPRDLRGDAGVGEHLAQAVREALRGLSSGVRRVVELGEHREPGRGGERVPRQRAGLVHGPERRELVHHAARPPTAASGSPPPITLPKIERSGVMPYARLRAAERDPEAGDHLVEHEQRAVRGCSRSRRPRGTRRRGRRAPCWRRRLDEDRRDRRGRARRARRRARRGRCRARRSCRRPCRR